MSPAVQNAIAIVITVACAFFLLRGAVRSARHLLVRKGGGRACGGGCGTGCSDHTGGRDASRRPVTLEKLPPR